MSIIDCPCTSWVWSCVLRVWRNVPGIWSSVIANFLRSTSFSRKIGKSTPLLHAELNHLFVFIYKKSNLCIKMLHKFNNGNFEIGFLMRLYFRIPEVWSSYYGTYMYLGLENMKKISITLPNLAKLLTFGSCHCRSYFYYL